MLFGPIGQPEHLVVNIEDPSTYKISVNSCEAFKMYTPILLL